MLYTDNIGLKKPAYNDPGDIADLNENSDIIDREFGNRYLKSETYSVEQANNAIAQAKEEIDEQLSVVKSDILSAEKAIEINQRSIGMQVSKNVFDLKNWEKSLIGATRGQVEDVENGIKFTHDNSNTATAYTNPYLDSNAKTHKIPVEANTEYILSWETNTVNSGFIRVYFNGQSTYYEDIANTGNINSKKFKTTSVTRYLSLQLRIDTAGESTTFTNIMIRKADIIDGTYEPYVPSVNERLTANENDILSVANNVTTTNAKAGTSTTNTLSSVGWHRIFAAERQQFARSGILMINRAFGSREPESHTILFNITQGRAVLELLNKNVEKQSISKLRLVHANSSPQSKACFIDIYYNETGENKITSSVFCESIVATGAGSNFMNSRFVASNLSADIPEGYTSTELSLTNGDFLDRLTALETALSQT